MAKRKSVLKHETIVDFLMVKQNLINPSIKQSLTASIEKDNILINNENYSQMTR